MRSRQKNTCRCQLRHTAVGWSILWSRTTGRTLPTAYQGNHSYCRLFVLDGGLYEDGLLNDPLALGGPMFEHHPVRWTSFHVLFRSPVWVLES